MLYQWLRKPKSLGVLLVMLSLMFIIACRSATQPDTSGTDAAKPADAQPKAQPKAQATAAPAAAKDTRAPAAVPQAQQPPAGQQFKLDQLIVAPYLRWAGTATTVTR